MRTYYIRKDKLIIMQNIAKQSEDETKNNIVQKIQTIKHEKKKKKIVIVHKRKQM